MIKENKDEITIWSAIGMLLFGVAITGAGFIVPPLGDISDSVLWVLGLCLIYSGSVFGVSIYIKNKITNMEEKVLKRVDEELDKLSK